MNIASTQYSLTYGAFEVYISGCDGLCGCTCHNRELWNFDLGSHYSNFMSYIKKKVTEFSSVIEYIWILGGEPLLQDIDELYNMIIDLKGLGKEIVLFTRFDLEEIPEEIKSICDFIKCGKYEEGCLSDSYICKGIKLATSNQKIYTLGEDY